MPIYEYKCSKCGKEFEVLQKNFDVDDAPCEACGGTGKRFMSNTSFVLKGTGWYVTDYKSNGGCSAAGGNGSSKSSEKKSGDAGTADASSSPCSKASSGAGCASCPSAASSADAGS
jgi:putative FmdB family regulatory protein